MASQLAREAIGLFNTRRSRHINLADRVADKSRSAAHPARRELPVRMPSLTSSGICPRSWKTQIYRAVVNLFYKDSLQIQSIDDIGWGFADHAASPAFRIISVTRAVFPENSPILPGTPLP